jgi:spore germination protein KB
LRHSLGGFDYPAARAAAGIKTSRRDGSELNVEEGKISGLQLALLLTAVLEGTFYLFSFTVNLSKQNTWLTVLVSFMTIVPFGYIYARLIKRFPGRNLAAIHNMIYGRYLGVAVSSFYLVYFLLALSFATKDVADFYSILFMRETPQEIMLIVFTCVCAYAVWHGIEVLARIAPFAVTALSLIIIVSTIMLLPKMSFANFLPIGELPLIDLIHGTQIMAEIHFGVVVIIFLPIAFAVNNQRQVERALFVGLLTGVAFFFLIAIRNTAVLGNTEPVFSWPSFRAFRLINLGFLSRLDILFTFGLTFGRFLLCSIYFYITALLLSQLLGLRTYLPLLFPLGCLTVILAMINYSSTTEHFQSAQNVEIMLFFPVMFIFPPLSLLIAKIRNLPRKGGL